MIPRMQPMAILVVWLTLAALQLCHGADGDPPPAEDAFIYVATYSPQAGEGIFVATFDSRSGLIGNLQPTGGLQSPAALAIHPNVQFLYATTTWSPPDSEATGGVVALEINTATGMLSEIDRRASEGTGPCSVD